MAAGVSRNLISETDGNPPERLRVRLLGGFSVSVDGRPVPEAAWRQRRAASVVKLLALEPSHRLHRERLMDQCWPELGYAAQLNNLRQALHHARRAIEAVGMPPGMVLERNGDIVVLAPARTVWVDALAFERATADVWQALTPATAQAALDLYAGDLLPDDPYEEWIERRRTTLRASFVALLARLAALHEERGDLPGAIGAWQRLVALDSTDEAAHLALMRLYAGCGQPHLALAQYDRLTDVLEREMDTSPEPATQALAEAIREGRVHDTAPLASGPPRAGPISLPAPISHLIGRERELAELQRLIESERLVTLTGPGGVGKTRLAIELARNVAGAFPDGVVFVDLAPVRTPEIVLPSIAQALGVRETSSRSMGTTLASSLRGKRLLLVLDNLEQVVAAGREITLMMEQAPALKVLVTSRVELRLRGERAYSVPPLAVADGRSPAVALFVERARDVRPEFTLTDANAAVIAAICHRLDGLPLAIELAAARSRILAPQAILDRLIHPLASLGTGAADLPERQQTLRATIRWSYDLLDADEQQLLASLSVFVDGWTLEAAEAVVGDAQHAIDVLDGLDSLAAKSLITRRPEPDDTIRFGMLETIRQFGRERLAANGMERAARNRHAAWVVRLVEEAEPHLEDAEQVHWLARLEHDRENIRAGLEWLRERGNAEPALRMVRALRLHWFTRGRLREGYEQIIAVTEMPESAAYPALRADALTAAGFITRELGDYQRAYDVIRTSLAISHQIHDRKRAADALVNLGFIALQRGQIDDARSLLQRSLTASRELHNDQGIADSLGVLALTDVQLGDLDTAGQRLEQCIAIWSRLDDLQGVAWANTQLGLVRIEQGDYPAAWESLITSLTMANRLDFRGDIYLALDGLARLALVCDRVELACRLEATSAAVREESGIRPAPIEQDRIDRLRADLDALPDRATISDAWTLDQLTQMVSETLAPLLAIPIPATSPAMPAVSHAEPTN